MTLLSTLSKSRFYISLLRVYIKRDAERCAKYKWYEMEDNLKYQKDIDELEKQIDKLIKDMLEG